MKVESDRIQHKLDVFSIALCCSATCKSRGGKSRHWAGVCQDSGIMGLPVVMVPLDIGTLYI